MLHELRGLHEIRPDWVFAGPSAAVALGFSVGWGSLIQVVVASEPSGREFLDGAVRTLRAPTGDVAMASGIPVTPAAQTVFDCARTLGLREGLAVADSALSAGDVGRRELAEFVQAKGSRWRGARWAMRRERIRESRLRAVGGAVMRFSPADVEDSAGLARLLDGFGIPREHEPLIQVPAPPEYPGEEPVPIEAYWFD